MYIASGKTIFFRTFLSENKQWKHNDKWTLTMVQYQGRRGTSGDCNKMEKP